MPTAINSAITPPEQVRAGKDLNFDLQLTPMRGRDLSLRFFVGIGFSNESYNYSGLVDSNVPQGDRFVLNKKKRQENELKKDYGC